MELMVALLSALQDETTMNFGLKQGLAALGAGLAIVGGGAGIGKLAAAAMEGMARQPEAAGDIRGGMILAAALIGDYQLSKHCFNTAPGLSGA